MSWRTVVLTGRAKLDLQLGSLVIRGTETKKIHISEIAVVIVESTAISMTAALLSELTKHKVKIILCDEKRNPQAELLPYYGSHDSSAKIREQIAWKPEIMGAVWTEIVRAKITNQLQLLQEHHLPGGELLERYLSELTFRDSTNREGLAAKAYFPALFGADFTRELEDPFNYALNYGYSLLLSGFNREIAANGYLTQLGLFHDNMFNSFNLASDLMEPFRPLVDRTVLALQPSNFGKEEKKAMAEIFSQQLVIGGNRQYLLNAIQLYCRSVFQALNEDNPSALLFAEL